MVKPEVIRRRIGKLEEYLAYLKKISLQPEDAFISTPEYFGSAERFLQLSIEMINDMGSHIVADEGLGQVNRSADVPGILFNKGLIDQYLYDQWTKMIGFRNLLVHEYLMIDRKIVYQVLQTQIDDLEKMKLFFANYL
jgi:uncharacterized protein YutE (UPF0331/DUF86 family)